MNYSAETLSDDDNEEMLAAIAADPSAWFHRLLPRRLATEGGPFLCFVQMVCKPGKAGAMQDFMMAVHEETDRNELEVYAHRCMQGKFDVDENVLGLIIEYDEPQAYLNHYNGENIREFYQAGILSMPPRLSFYREC